MAKKINAITPEIAEVIAQAVAAALAAQTPAKKPSSAKQKKSTKGKGKAKLVEFTKHSGEVILCTPAQAANYARYRDGYENRVAAKARKEEALAVWEEKRKSYKPSKALKDAIKADRASITFKVAKEQYGFVGTKESLKALKDSICK